MSNNAADKKSLEKRMSTTGSVLEKGKFDNTISQEIVADDKQKYLRKKFDVRVLPIVVVLYVLSYLDRGNIGNARVAGVQKDLGLSQAQVGIHFLLLTSIASLTILAVDMGSHFLLHCL